MCRFALYLGPKISISSLVTEPTNSIINQSFHSHEQKEPLNGDGFGVAWYKPKISLEPAVFKDITPAWNNMNLINLARLTQSPCILAHVRAATAGLAVIELNCHPFSWGPFAFMHNGRIAGFKSMKREILNRLSNEAFHLIAGSTDSEHAFALFADHYLHLKEELSHLEAMVAALTKTIKEVEILREETGVEAASLLNFAIADGQCAVVSRYISHPPEEANTLYIHYGERYVCKDGVCKMVNPDVGNGAVIIASEPLNEDEGWHKVESNSLVVVDQNLKIETRPLEF